MTAGAKSGRAEVSFEVYVRRRDRWLVEDVLEDEEEALEFAQRLAQRGDLGGIRVVRETYDPERDEAYEEVIFETALDERKPRVEAAAPEHGPREPEMEADGARPRRQTAPKGKPFPWRVASFAGAGLLVAATGAWVALS